MLPNNIKSKSQFPVAHGEYFLTLPGQAEGHYRYLVYIISDPSG